ncbi:PEPxxWA-CTERM sorting domain-containing protein [Sphingobium boeckii]|uniref:PEPxxWA-CTERM sorting domain-containing protein n=1 Tax=Sphingobium boeckii TaxID=1082345 RepID=UPI001FE643EE|nr:PEPxxWA-CTERM sorting domain-containing protein [Sphingobium boeckii]
MSLIACAASLAAAVPASAGTLIVAGDATTAFRLNTGVTTGAASLAGNVTFAKNILGGGTKVSIMGDSENFGIAGQLTNAYNSFAGVTATGFFGTITAELLAGTDLFMAFFPSRAFTVAETGVISDFLSRGGTFFVAGESERDAFGNALGQFSNARVNTLLGNLGASISLGKESLDISDQFATGAEIVANPLTAGVQSFGYGLTTTVQGGQALFLTNDLKPFVAVQTLGAVPEPATWAMMIAGFGLTGVVMRRRRPERQAAHA